MVNFFTIHKIMAGVAKIAAFTTMFGISSDEM